MIATPEGFTGSWATPVVSTPFDCSDRSCSAPKESRPDAPDQPGFRAESRRGDRLVRSLPARGRVEALADERLPWVRQPWRDRDQVHVDPAQDDDRRSFPPAIHYPISPWSKQLLQRLGHTVGLHRGRRPVGHPDHFGNCPFNGHAQPGPLDHLDIVVSVAEGDRVPRVYSEVAAQPVERLILAALGVQDLAEIRERPRHVQRRVESGLKVCLETLDLIILPDHDESRQTLGRHAGQVADRVDHHVVPLSVGLQAGSHLPDVDLVGVVGHHVHPPRSDRVQGLPSHSRRERLVPKHRARGGVGDVGALERRNGRPQIQAPGRLDRAPEYPARGEGHVRPRLLHPRQHLFGPIRQWMTEGLLIVPSMSRATSR